MLAGMPTEIDKELTIELLVAAIDTFTAKHGYPPSVRDLCEVLDIKSTSTTHKYVKIAKRRELVITTPGVARSIRLTEAGRLLV